MCHGVLIFAAADKYGPFAPLVGYVVSIVSTVVMIGYLVRGPLRNWDIPDEAVPKVLGRVLGFLGAAFIVIGWFIATPSIMPLMLAIAAAFILVASFCAVRFALLTPRYQYYKEVANPDGRTTHRVPVLAGDELSSLAKNEQKQNHTVEQDMLAQVAYDADKIWPRPSRVRVMQKFALMYIFALSLGPAGISWLAFVVQVRLTGKPAAAVIRQEEAPGIEHQKLPSSAAEGK